MIVLISHTKIKKNLKSWVSKIEILSVESHRESYVYQLAKNLHYLTFLSSINKDSHM